MLRLSPPYPATAVRPKVAFWPLCLQHFASARSATGERHPALLPDATCCQLLCSSCRRCLSGVSLSSCCCSPSPAAGAALQEQPGSVLAAAVGPSSSAMEQLPASLQQVLGSSCCQMGKAAASLGCGGGLEPGLLGWGVTEGLKAHIQLLQLLGSDHPARDLEEPVCHPALQLSGSSS